MGSLPSPSRSQAGPPPASNSDPSSNYRVFMAFCPREPSPNGSISNWIDSYDPFTNTWSHVSPIPGLRGDQVLKGFAMVSLGDSIYIIGGQLCYKERVHVSDDLAELVDIGIEVVPTVLGYNIQSNQWSNCSPLGVARYEFACTVCDNKIYVAGGKSMLASARGIASAEVYDPVLDKWTLLPNMNILRYKSVAVTWQGKIHVVGGFADREYSDPKVPSVIERSSAEVYDTQARKWDIMEGMWLLDVPPNQIVDVNGTLFSSGDCLNAWKGHIEAYDGRLKIWNEVEGSHRRCLFTMEAPNQRLYLTMAPIGTRLYFLAGYRMDGDSSSTISKVHTFDTSASHDPWKSFEPTKDEGEKELCSHCCVAQLS